MCYLSYHGSINLIDNIIATLFYNAQHVELSVSLLCTTSLHNSINYLSRESRTRFLWIVSQVYITMFQRNERLHYLATIVLEIIPSKYPTLYICTHASLMNSKFAGLWLFLSFAWFLFGNRWPIKNSNGFRMPKIETVISIFFKRKTQQLKLDITFSFTPSYI